jgi:hypothetical protein
MFPGCRIEGAVDSNSRPHVRRKVDPDNCTLVPPIQLWRDAKHNIVRDAIISMRPCYLIDTIPPKFTSTGRIELHVQTIYIVTGCWAYF